MDVALSFLQGFHKPGTYSMYYLLGVLGTAKASRQPTDLMQGINEDKFPPKGSHAASPGTKTEQWGVVHEIWALMIHGPLKF